jgi:Raf kinase inhibitor-like YbhB/YbcL family protein
MPAMRASLLAALAAVLGLFVFLAACGDDKTDAPPRNVPETIKVSSPAFKEGGTIPVGYTCDGKLGGVSPPLGWTNKPKDAKNQALIVTDPDAPSGTFVHWTVWGMMARTNGLEADIPPLGLPQGKNSAGTSKYAPPCPPKGDSPHRYEFAIYALKEPLGLKPGSPEDAVVEKIKRVAIARGVLTGKYSR